MGYQQEPFRPIRWRVPGARGAKRKALRAIELTVRLPPETVTVNVRLDRATSPFERWRNHLAILSEDSGENADLL